MSLVAAKCTQCGANLKIDNTLEAAVCPHCKTPFITEKAINNYNTYNQSTYNIQHANLQVNDEKSIENRLKNAEVFLTKHKDYKKAMELFKEISEDAPDDYRTWWGIVRVGTREFTTQGTYEYYLYSNDYDRALQVAPEDAKGRLTKTWQEYQEYLKPDFSRELNIIEFERDSCEAKLNDLNKQLNNLNKQRSELNKRIEGLQQNINKQPKWFAIAISLGILLCIFGLWILGSENSNINAGYGILSLFISGCIFFDLPKKSDREKFIRRLTIDIKNIDSKISSMERELQNIEVQSFINESSINRLKQIV
jgi:chaperonin cofactor prefoldin